VVGTAAIAGIPPLNGYVSLSLIHDGLRESHQELPYALMLVAHLVTVAALGRAAWLAFFRPGTQSPNEQLKPGMAVGLIGLGTCCVGFGVFGQYALHRAMAPAAALLDGSAYTLSGGRLPLLHVSFHFLDLEELLVLTASLVLAALLARTYLRIKEPAPMSFLRALHNGSVNDYAAYATAGAIALIAVLRLS